ncbi:hypothetical protein BH10PLA2_BH10PLA2_04280 [soil metagenome]
MPFAPPGQTCVTCSCRKTNPAKPKELEIPLSYVIPFQVHKCPHCGIRFWRLSIPKLLGMAVVACLIASAAYLVWHG